MADRQRGIFVGLGREARIDEHVARHDGHRIQHALIGHAVRTQAFDHPFANPFRSQCRCAVADATFGAGKRALVELRSGLVHRRDGFARRAGQGPGAAVVA